MLFRSHDDSRVNPHLIHRAYPGDWDQDYRETENAPAEYGVSPDSCFKLPEGEVHDWQSACCVTLDRNTTWHGVLPSRNKLASALSSNASLIDPPKPPDSPAMAAVITAPATTIEDTGPATRKRRSRPRKHKITDHFPRSPARRLCSQRQK